MPEFCDGAGGCPADEFQPEGTPCGDPEGTPCDNPDTCDASGVCQPNPATPTVECRPAAGECDLAEFCDGAGGCPVDGFKAEGEPCGDSTDTACDNPDSCDGQGVCLANPEPDGTSCEDGLFCNGADTCQSGVCADGADPCPDSCTEDCHCPCASDDDCPDDGLDCTSRRCRLDGCCEQVLDSGHCLIIGLCYNDDDRSPDNDCLLCDPFADPENWTPAPTGAPCGDPTDNACTDPDTCDGSAICLPNHAPDGTSCADELFCNGAETCQSGECVDGPDPCPTGWVCNEDLDRCECNDPGDCDDSDECTDDKCDAGVCVHTRIPNCPCRRDCASRECGDDGCRGSCGTCPDDTLFCTGAPVCVDGICGFGPAPCGSESPVCCEQAETCVAQCCSDNGCRDDDLFCNGTERCIAGTCQSTDPPCMDDECCEERTDSCRLAPSCRLHADCDDNDPCTVDACADGCCVNTAECLSNAECNDRDPCTTDVCDQGCCAFLSACNVDAECDDANPCTVDVCSDGCCDNTAMLCPGGLICIDGACVWTLTVSLRVDQDFDGDGTLEEGVPLATPAEHYGDGLAIDVPVPEAPCGVDRLCNFLRWEGEGVSAETEKDDPLSLTFNGDWSVIAVFQVVSCVDDTDCQDDGKYCNGVEECIDGVCISAGSPCPNPDACNEEGDCCVVGVPNPGGTCGACGSGSSFCVVIGLLSWLSLRGQRHYHRRGESRRT